MKRYAIQIFLIAIITTISFPVNSQVSSNIKIKNEKRNLEIVTQFHSSKGYISNFIKSGRMTEDVEWFVPGPKEILPFAGMWKGADGITEFNRLLSATMRYDKTEIKEYIVDGDQVAAIFWGEGIAKATGKPFKSEILRLYTFKDGKIIKVRNFYDTSSYVEAVSK